MNSAQALQAFWSSFEWAAIDEQSSYDDDVMEALEIPDKYIAYEAAVSELGEPVSLTASLWHRTSKWTEIEGKANEIFEAIGLGGVKVPYDGGQLWITRRMPFSRRGPTVQDLEWRRIIININAEYLSA